MTIQYTPYFIVAAPRSGTKILRDTLAQHHSIQTTQKPREDIWTYGQEKRSHESYPPESVTDDIKKHIRNAFKQLRSNNHKIFVEKNVRHSLRIPYIKEIFPDARFIHIIRDGRDEVVSNLAHKKDPFDWNYYLSSKIFELSPLDIVKHGYRLGLKLVKRLLVPNQDVAIWGPRFKGFTEIVDSKSPLEISALQWKHCTSKARCDGKTLTKNDYFEIHYEGLMKDPAKKITQLAEFMNVTSAKPMIDFGINNYRTDRIERWKTELNQEQLQTVESIIGEWLVSFGYSPALKPFRKSTKRDIKND